MPKTPDQLAKQRAQAKARRADPEYRRKWSEYQRQWAKTHPLTDEQKARKYERRRQRYAADPSLRIAAQRRRVEKGSRAKEHRLRKYGLDDSSYQRMMNAQRGLCALCGNHPTRKTHVDVLHVDHDHETGEVRGLLCFPCNAGLAGYERFLKTCGVDAVNRYLAGWPEAETEPQATLSQEN